jgi:prepilin-type processing-associated H-X9-DG protein
MTGARVSYGWNEAGVDSGVLKGGFGMSGKFDSSLGWPLPPKETQVRNPSEMIVSGDALCTYLFLSHTTNGMTGSVFYPAGLSFSMVDQPRGTSGSFGDLVLRGDGVYERRHRGRFNILFCDSHVVSFRIEDLFNSASDLALARWNIDNLPHREVVQSP